MLFRSGTAGLEASARVGVGLEGVLDESGDGLIFAGVGYRQDGPAQGETTIPGRGALTLRVRAPFWLVPGDMVVAAPLLALTISIPSSKRWEPTWEKANL